MNKETPRIHRRIKIPSMVDRWMQRRGIQTNRCNGTAILFLNPNRRPFEDIADTLVRPDENLGCGNFFELGRLEETEVIDHDLTTVSEERLSDDFERLQSGSETEGVFVHLEWKQIGKEQERNGHSLPFLSRQRAMEEQPEIKKLNLRYEETRVVRTSLNFLRDQDPRTTFFGYDTDVEGGVVAVPRKEVGKYLKICEEDGFRRIELHALRKK